jgi:hypothetical protein
LPRDAQQLASQRTIVGIWGNLVFALWQLCEVGRDLPRAHSLAPSLLASRGIGLQ